MQLKSMNLSYLLSFCCRQAHRTALKRIPQQCNPGFKRNSQLHSLISSNLFISRCCSTAIDNCRDSADMDLQKFVKLLHKIASPSLAGSWDNVGLLVEPSPPHIINTVFLTNDLTPPVLDEALSLKADMILSYHPPIFSPLKRLTQNSWKEKIVIKCIENRIALFSPHTSYDCVLGGVNDWLIECFDCSEVQPVEQHEEPTNGFRKHVTVYFEGTSSEALKQTLSLIDGVKLHQQSDQYDLKGSSGVISFRCVPSSLKAVMKCLQEHRIMLENIEVLDLAKVPSIGYGMGRKGQLKEPTSIENAVRLVKQHLNLCHLRLATSPDCPEIKSVAVCAGSGSSVLRNVKADLYVTGEMSHHDVLHAVYNGTSVILCEHSNTERGYLKVIQQKIQELTNRTVTVHVTNVDADPLNIV